MSDRINLEWTINVSYTADKYNLFEALANLCTTYYGDIPKEYDYAEFIIEWLEENLEDYIEEFLDILDPEIIIDGDLDYNNITDLLDNEKFMEEFRDYLND